jgi:hypothetical protein
VVGWDASAKTINGYIETHLVLKHIRVSENTLVPALSLVRDAMQRNLRALFCGLIAIALCGCITLPSTFVSDGNGLVHKPTGVKYPKKIADWNLLEGATDKVDSEIAATASYQRTSFAKTFNGNFMPYATVYVLSSKNTDGIRMLESRLKKQAPRAVFEGNQKIKTQAGIVTASVFGHAAAVSMAPLVAQAINAESWLIQYPGQQFAFWITIDKGQSDERSAPTEFVNRFAEGLAASKSTVQ